MTKTQKEKNKNLILNNLDKYTIDGKGNFVNLEKDYDDSDYIIWKNEVADYEKVKEKVAQEIVKDKSRWNSIHNKEIIDDIMEVILLEKENWEIVYDDELRKITGSLHEKFYKYRPTGEKINAWTYEIFDFTQSYIIMGELGRRDQIWEDYDKWGHYRIKEWWGWRKWKKKQKNKNKPPINPPSPSPTPPKEETKKYEEAKKKAEEQHARQQEPFQKKITEIKSALSEELPLTNSDLSPQYQNWEEHINNSNDLQQVTNFQNKILTNIQACREDKKKYLNSIEKFASIPNFNKEKLQNLIEPVKNNPAFLQKLKENNIQNLVSLIVDKSPQEIIITIKRFEYDQEKEKKIRAYYHLNPNDDLTDEQVNNYLYREAIGQITSPTENLNQESNGLLIPLILGGGLLVLFSAIVIARIKLKRR